MKEEEGRFAFCVGAIIENPKGEILLIKRSPDSTEPNIWDDVGGKVEQYEDPIDALYREIKEETGLKEVEIVKIIDVFYWFHENSQDDMIGVTYWCKTVSTKIILSSEHTDYCWIQPKQAIVLAEHPIVVSNIKNYIKEKEITCYTS